MSLGFTSAQLSTSACEATFSREATNFTSLASIMAGGLAYRLGKMAGLQFCSTLFSSNLTRMIPGLLAPVMGLAAEVTAFQGTDRLLQSLQHGNENLFRFSGENGFVQGWRNSFVDFGMMKGVGHLLQSSNIILQHLAQDFSMVAGHQATALLGFTSRPEGNFLDQMVHAEITNLQLGVGGRFSAFATGHRLRTLERSMEQQFYLPASETQNTYQALVNLRSQDSIRLGDPREDRFITDSLNTYDDPHYVTDLLPEFDAQYKETLERMRSREIAFQKGQLQLHEILKQNGLRRLEDAGEEITRYRLEETDRLERARIPIPDWIKQYLEENPEDRKLEIVRIEVEDPETASDDFRFAHFVANMFEMGLGLAPGSLRTKSSVIIFPAKLYREAAVRLHGTQAIHRIPVDRDLSLREMEEFRRRGNVFVDEWPVQIGRCARIAHGLRLSSFILAEHDNVHPLFLEQLSREFREDIFDIYLSTRKAFESLSIEIEDDLLSPIFEALVVMPEGVGKDDYKSVLLGIRTFLEERDPSGKFPKSFVLNLRELFNFAHPRHVEVENAIQEVFRDTCLAIAKEQSSNWLSQAEGDLLQRTREFRGRLQNVREWEDVLQTEYERLSFLMQDLARWRAQCRSLRVEMESAQRIDADAHAQLRYYEAAIHRIQAGTYVSAVEHLVASLERADANEEFWIDELKNCTRSERASVAEFIERRMENGTAAQRLFAVVLLTSLHEFSEDTQERRLRIPGIFAASLDASIEVQNRAHGYMEHLLEDDPTSAGHRFFLGELEKVWQPLHANRMAKNYYKFFRSSLEVIEREDPAEAAERFYSFENAIVENDRVSFWQETCTSWVNLRDARRRDRCEALIPIMGTVGGKLYITTVGDMMEELPEVARNDAVEKMLFWLGSREHTSAVCAEYFLRKKIRYLEKTLRYRCAMEIIHYYDRGFANPFLRYAEELAANLNPDERLEVGRDASKIYSKAPKLDSFSNIVRAFIETLPAQACGEFLDLADEMARSFNPVERSRGIFLYRRLMPRMEISARMTRAHLMMKYAMDNHPDAFESVAHIFRYLPPVERLVFFKSMVAYSGVVENLPACLDIMSVHLNQRERFQLLALYTQGQTSAVELPILLGGICMGMRAQDLRHYAIHSAKSNREERTFLNLSYCVRANLHPHTPDLLDRMDQDPVITLRRVEEINRRRLPYIEGCAGSVVSPKLAFAALGHTQLFYNSWFETIMQQALPKAFLGREHAFEFEVQGAVSAHRILDKGQIDVILEPVACAVDLSEVRRRVLRILTTNRGSARREIREFAIRTFEIADPTTDLTQQRTWLEERLQDETKLLEVVQGLHEILSANVGADAQRRGDSHVLFLSGYLHQRPTQLAKLRKAVSEYQKIEGNTNEEGMPSVILERAFEALHELYSEGPQHVHPSEVPTFVALKNAMQARVDQLNEERARAALQVHHVRILPIKERLDAAFGFLGDDCNKSKIYLLQKENFQTARVIVDGQWMGMIYIQSSRRAGDTTDAPEVLHIAFAPRRNLRVNMTQFVRQVAEGFKQIGVREHYQSLLISSDRLEQGNVPDVRQAIADMNLQEIEFEMDLPVIFHSLKSLVYYDRDQSIF